MKSKVCNIQYNTLKSLQLEPPAFTQIGSSYIELPQAYFKQKNVFKFWPRPVSVDMKIPVLTIILFLIFLSDFKIYTKYCFLKKFDGFYSFLLFLFKVQLSC